LINKNIITIEYAKSERERKNGDAYSIQGVAADETDGKSPYRITYN
jgi:hypothetical protein